LIDESVSRGLLVELEERGDLLALFLEVCKLGRVLGRSALGVESLLGLLIELGEH
jgi:hypothetical protein